MKIVSKHRLLTGTALAFAAGLTLYGCKDFLTNAATPQGTLDEKTLQNLAGVEGTLIAAYRTLDCTGNTNADWGCAASNWVWGSASSDDAYKGSEASDQPPIDQIEEFHWSPPDAQGYLNTKWRAMYEGVVRANSALRLLRAVSATPGAIPAEDAKGIAGEAIFLRAHYHFEAWRMWGNIPYYREDDTDFRKANELSAAVVTDLLKDLDSAIVLLPTSPRKGQVGRVTRWTAMAYKGRVQMYAGQFAAALTTLTAVKNSGVYALEASFDRVWTGYKDYENGKETILAYQASANDGEPDGTNANYGERLNFPHSGSPLGCCGFHQPSQNLVNFFHVDAAGLPIALSSATWNADSSAFTAGATAAVDPRLDFTVGRDGVPFKDWGPHQRGWIRSPTYGGAYSAKKNVHEQTSGAQSSVGWVNTQLNSVNIHIFRYADLLLLLAEAEVEVGSLENARAIVNQIRTRAGVKVQGPGCVTAGATCTANRAQVAVPINDPSVTWATYRVGLYTAPFADQATARAAVRTERRLELAMEGTRFFDLRRWNIADQVLNAYLNGVAGGAEEDRRTHLRAAELFTARHKLFPIPDLQIRLSKVGETSSLTQNTGW